VAYNLDNVSGRQQRIISLHPACSLFTSESSRPLEQQLEEAAYTLVTSCETPRFLARNWTSAGFTFCGIRLFEFILSRGKYLPYLVSGTLRKILASYRTPVRQTPTFAAGLYAAPNHRAGNCPSRVGHSTSLQRSAPSFPAWAYDAALLSLPRCLGADDPVIRCGLPGIQSTYRRGPCRPARRCFARQG
jgi:hypothetical protein